MSTKIDSPSEIESNPGQFNAPVSTSSTSSTSSPKVSMFGTKAGFVIPKNKLSGSLVPIFRGGSKVDAGSIVKEDSAKQVKRKTKWGTDLTQDATVRKGKALAYQTRVEQITQQLKFGSLEFEDDQDTELPKLPSITNSISDHADIKSHKVELLELERRELIGEILRLNPSFKAPPDYKPLLKESKVPIPIKTDAVFNFVGLLLGPESNTQKRLEEETGAKVRIYGTKSGLGEKREITKSDTSEALDAYEDLYVHISADTYEKVDTAVALIELLLSQISKNAAVNPKVASSSAGCTEDFQGRNYGSPNFFLAASASNNVVQSTHPISSPAFQPSRPPIQPYPGLPWLRAGTQGVPSHLSPALMPNSPHLFPHLRPLPGMPYYFAQPPLNIVAASRTPPPAFLRPQLPIQLSPNRSPSVPVSQSLNPSIWPLVMPGPPSIWPSVVNAPAPFSNSTMRPPLAVSSAPIIPGPPLFNASENASRLPSANFAHCSTLLFSAPLPTTSTPIFSPSARSHTASVSLALPPSPTPPGSVAPSPTPSALPHSAPFPHRVPSAPLTSPRPPLIMPTASTQAPMLMQPLPSFPQSANNPINALPAFAAPKPPRPVSGDFTFHPLGTQPPSSPNAPRSQNSAAQSSPPAPFAAPNAPPIHALQSPVPAALAQSSSWPPLPDASPLPTVLMMASFPSRSSIIRSPSPMIPASSPRSPHAASFPRTVVQGVNAQFSIVQNPIALPPGNEQAAHGSSQIYDPFSPTASATRPHHGAVNPANNAQQNHPEADAEYEDLMASVGVK